MTDTALGFLVGVPLSLVLVAGALALDRWFWRRLRKAIQDKENR